MQLFSLCSSDWLWETINGLFLIICNWVYILIGFLYKVFMAVARVNLFDKETFSKLTDRIYVVIGIAMLFIFAYNLILMIINPDDKKSTGATTKVVKETIISLTLVILLPTIFNWLYIFQNNILESNIIGKVILGGIGSDSSNSDNCAEGDYDCSCDFSNFRGLDKYIFDVKNIDESRSVREELGDMCNENKKISTDSERGAKSIGSLLMSTFYKPTNFSFQDCVDYLQNKKEDLESEEDRQICVNYFYDVTSSRYMGDTASFVMDPYLRNIVSDSKKNSMEFNFVMALVSGILAIYMFFCYTMEIGVRVAKLGVLQLISPIPVMMRIIPKQKEGIYDKWFNHLKNTYLDVFIRLMIIFFALFAISLVPDVIDTLFNSAKNSSDSTFISTLALVFVILGILKFAQEAPELLKDFFGSSGRFSLKSPAKQLSENKLAMGAINAGRASIYGATTGKGWGRVGGFFSGMARGAIGGYDKAVKGIDTIRTERANGSTFGGRMLDRTRIAVGMETVGESAERNLEKKFQTKSRTELNEKVQKDIDKIKSTVDAKIEKEDSSYKFDLKDSNGNTFRYKGVNFKNLNYSGYQKIIETMQKDIENETDLQKRIHMQQQLSNVNVALEKAKKQAVTDAVTSVFNGGDAGGLLNAADRESILTAQRNINMNIKENKVGVTYDKNGNIDKSSVWTDQITDATQLFGGKDSNGNDIANLRDTLTNQRANISERTSQVQSGNYGRYQANSRMARGSGKAEKK